VSRSLPATEEHGKTPIRVRPCSSVAWSICVLLGVSVAPVAAQERPARYSVWFNAGAGAAAPSLNDRFTFEMHAEDATVAADYRSRAAVLIDGGFAVRIRKAIGIGVAVSRFSGEDRAGIEAQIPYPFDFDVFREVSGTTPGLDHTELGYHVQVQYSRPVSRRLRLVLSAGPTVFSVRRQLVETVQVDEEYPFETATFRSANSRIATGTGIGFNAGADVVWPLGRNTGVGAMVRYARGTADLKGPARATKVDTGGVQGGAGLRIYF
jgi:hypothetical protein